MADIINDFAYPLPPPRPRVPKMGLRRSATVPSCRRREISPPAPAVLERRKSFCADHGMATGGEGGCPIRIGVGEPELGLCVATVTARGSRRSRKFSGCDRMEGGADRWVGRRKTAAEVREALGGEEEEEEEEEGDREDYIRLRKGKGCVVA